MASANKSNLRYPILVVAGVLAGYAFFFALHILLPFFKNVLPSLLGISTQTPLDEYYAATVNLIGATIFALLGGAVAGFSAKKCFKG